MKKYFAEFLGTFALVFCGTGAIVINEFSQGAITHPGIAATFGLVVAAMIFAFGDVSGAHFNPAVTVSFFAAGKFRAAEILPYVLAQGAGALLASGMLAWMFPENVSLGATLPAGLPQRSFILEIILTFFLMLVILQVATGSRERGMFAAVAIGSVVLLEALFAGPVCGASMNPVRSLAPAVVSGNLDFLWIYLTAPLIGGILAVGAWKVLQPREKAAA